MRDAFYRLTAPILDRIPNISNQPQRRQISIGLAASILFHVLLLAFALFYEFARRLLTFILALILTFLPPSCSELAVQKPKPKPKLEEIEVTIIPPTEEVRLVPLEEIEHPKPFIDSRGLASSEKEPEKSIFESDVNMKAASELPALGSLPLPSQAGRTEPDFPAFADQQISLGKTVAPFSRDSSPPAPPTPPADPTPPAPPAVAPPTVPAAEPGTAKEMSPPTPLKEVTKPAEDEIALAAKQAAPAAPPPVMPRMRVTQPVAMLATPAPQARSKPGYSPQLQKTRIEGNISNRGRNAVDAAGTPLGRYKKAVYDAVGSRWYRYTEMKTSMIAPGSVRVSFSIDSKGRAVSVKSEGNTSNGSFANLCEQAVREAEIAPPPDDLTEPLLDGKLDFTITFTFHTF